MERDYGGEKCEYMCVLLCLSRAVGTQACDDTGDSNCVCAVSGCVCDKDWSERALSPAVTLHSLRRPSFRGVTQSSQPGGQSGIVHLLSPCVTTDTFVLLRSAHRTRLCFPDICVLRASFILNVRRTLSVTPPEVSSDYCMSEVTMCAPGRLAVSLCLHVLLLRHVVFH